MKLELGKIKHQYVTMPKFMVAIHKPRFCDETFWYLGRLYVGYVGLMWYLPPLFCLTVWVHSIEKD